jgi:integrase
MGKAHKLKSGNWRVQVFSHYEEVNGVKKMKLRSFTAPTKAEAEMMALQFAADKKRYTSCGYTVGEAVDNYIAAKETVLSPSTIRAYLCIRKHVGELEKIMVSDLTSEDLQKWVSRLTVILSAKSVKNVYTLVLSAVSVYSERLYKVTLPKRKPLQYDVPTNDQVSELMENAREDLKLCIALAAVGTLRRGEICALKYKDVLKDKNVIYVHSDMILTKNNTWEYKEIPKTSDSVRFVELPEAVIRLLGEGDPEEFIIKSTPAAISDAFARLRDRLGLKCRFHDLRHYAASILHAIGVPDQYIMERGGWSTDGTLKAVYRNTLTDKSKEYSQKVNGYFNGVLSF